MKPVKSRALPKKPSSTVGKVLSPAIELWLRSLLERVEALEVKIEGRSSLLLGGYVPKVSLRASHAVYQGLHLRQIHLEAGNVRINLGQILRGKPLRLLEPVPVTGELLLRETDLNASIAAPLLANALTEFFVTLLPEEAFAVKSMAWQQIVVGNGELTLSGVCLDSGTKPVELRTSLQVEEGRRLRLDRLQIQGVTSIAPSSFEIDLGSEVNIQELTLTSGQLICRGRMLVRTEESEAISDL